MKYTPLDAKVFVENRKRLTSELKPNSVVIIRSNDIMPTNADGTMNFIQNSHLFWLTGVDQEESFLILAPDHPDEKMRELLFLRETSEEIAIWEGHKLTKEEGQQVSGIQQIKWTHEFEKTLNTILADSDCIYLYKNEHIRNATEVQTANDRLVDWVMKKYPLYEFERLAPVIYRNRTIKSSAEVEAIRHACQITEHGFRKILEVTAPGVWEYELEAEYLYQFVKNRSRGFAYTPIIAGGGNACVLHYIDNNQQLQDGDLLLMDVGAEYGNYNADMTRTIPVNGRFTERQRAVYDAVLRVKNGATDILRPGIKIPEYHKEVGLMMQSELVGLGLIDQTDIKNQNPDWPAYKKYFMHGTSHHLGLDVHDYASVFDPVKPGMVFTVEPGIYIREENIGVRLEDDIVITEDGHDNLMSSIPLEAEEIEELMQKK